MEFNLHLQDTNKNTELLISSNVVFPVLSTFYLNPDSDFSHRKQESMKSLK